MAFKKKKKKLLHFVKPRIVFIQAMAELLASQMRVSKCSLNRSLFPRTFPQKNSVGVKLPVCNFSDVCQGFCICIAAIEDS